MTPETQEVVLKRATDLFRMTVTSPAAEAFCRERCLFPELQDTISLIHEHFAVAAPIDLSVETDPETGEQWLEVSVAARGNVANVADARRRYNRRWHATAPGKITDNVRLFLHIAAE